MTDTIVVVAAVALAQYVRFGQGIFEPGYTVMVHTVYSAVLAAVWLVLLRIFRSRSLHVIGDGVEEYRRVSAASLWAFGSVTMVTLLAELTIARSYLAVALPAGLFGLVCSRWVWRKHISAHRRTGGYRIAVLAVGDEAGVTELAAELMRDPKAGYHVQGVCLIDGTDDVYSIELAGYEIPVFGTGDDIMRAIRLTGADTVAIAGGANLGVDRLRKLSWDLERHDVDLVVSPGVVDVAGPRLTMRPVSGYPLVHVEKPRYHGATAFTKGVFDRMGALLILVLVAPVLLAVAVAIKVTDWGPVFYRQRRVGLDGEEFSMWKFRSMVPDADNRFEAMKAAAGQSDNVFYKSRDDPRITAVGRIIRRASIDELPQLFNVLTGEMSLVGPRPLKRGEGAEIEGFVERRMLVRPGMTGLWQVSGRSELPEAERVRLDLYYVDNWSAWQDLAIMWRTVRAVAASDGAY